MTISIVGSAALDTLHTPEGKRERILGGSAVHAAIVASLFAEVELVSIVGSDFPESYKTYLCDKGISLQCLDQIDGNTFHWEGSYLEDLNSAKTLSTEVGVLADYLPRLEEKQKNSNILFCANNDPSMQLNAIQQSNSKLIALDTMNLWIDIAREKLDEVISLVDILFINEEETKQYMGIDNLFVAGRSLLEKNAKLKYVVIKKGEHGSILMGREAHELFLAPAVPLEIVKDPTGAGDSFAGSFLAYLSDKEWSWKELKQAVLVGTATASFYVEEFGSDNAATITREKIEERVELLKKYMVF